MRCCLPHFSACGCVPCFIAVLCKILLLTRPETESFLMASTICDKGQLNFSCLRLVLQESPKHC